VVPKGRGDRGGVGAKEDQADSDEVEGGGLGAHQADEAPDQDGVEDQGKDSHGDPLRVQEDDREAMGEGGELHAAPKAAKEGEGGEDVEEDNVPGREVQQVEPVDNQQQLGHDDGNPKGRKGPAGSNAGVKKKKKACSQLNREQVERGEQ